MMELKNSFKQKCLLAFQYSTQLSKIITATQICDLTQLRILIDEATDDLQREINQKIGTGEESIHNARIQQLQQMFECLNELYEIIEVNEFDRQSELLRSSSD